MMLQSLAALVLVAIASTSCVSASGYEQDDYHVPVVKVIHKQVHIPKIIPIPKIVSVPKYIPIPKTVAVPTPGKFPSLLAMILRLGPDQVL